MTMVKESQDLKNFKNFQHLEQFHLLVCFEDNEEYLSTIHFDKVISEKSVRSSQ